MGTSELIAHFIRELMSKTGGPIEIRRSELADRFNCVPSAINYVISTRFTPEHGFIVESRRGGGGYIRIIPIKIDPDGALMHTVNMIGDSVDEGTCAALIGNLFNLGVIDERNARVIAASISINALRMVEPAGRDALRASILKHTLLALRR